MKTTLAAAAALLMVGPVWPQELKDETFAGLHKLLVPANASWRELGWQPSLWDAVVEAQKQDKPILLWSMHGHPCAET